MLQKFALILGIVYLLAGVLGFIPALLSPPHQDPRLALDANYGYLLGLFPVNIMHNLVHLAVGVWGLAGSRSYGAALAFARGLAILYGVLAIFGFIPGLSTLFGLAPLYSHDIWLHALTAIAAAYFGWGPPSHPQKRTV